MRASRITSIKPLGLVNTYDIEIDNDNHIFWGNGIATSNSHGYSYALDGYYYSAYPKAHFPLEFYCVEMDFAHSKQGSTELENLCSVMEEAQKIGVEVRKPDIRYFNADFKILENKILFGLAKIKNVSKACIAKVQKQYPNIHSMSWNDIVLKVLNDLTYPQGEALIMSGAFDWTGVLRSQMLHDNSIINSKDTSLALSDKERQYLIEGDKSIRDGLKHLINNVDETILVKMKAITKKNQDAFIDSVLNDKIGFEEKKVLSNVNSIFNCKRRLFQLENPHRKCVDSLYRLSKWEAQVLGKSISCSPLDLSDQPLGDIRCIDIHNRSINIKQDYNISVVVQDYRTYKSFSGEGQVCYMKGGDSTASFSSFNLDEDIFSQCEDLIKPNKTLSLRGQIWRNKYNQQSFRVSEVLEI